MTKLRVTQWTVGELGLYAEAATTLKNWLGYSSDPGDGRVYKSGRSMKNWKGERAAHMCASYLLGVLETTPMGQAWLADPDHWVSQMKAAVDINEVERGEGKREAEHAIRQIIRDGGKLPQPEQKAAAE